MTPADKRKLITHAIRCYRSRIAIFTDRIARRTRKGEPTDEHRKAVAGLREVVEALEFVAARGEPDLGVGFVREAVREAHTDLTHNWNTDGRHAGMFRDGQPVAPSRGDRERARLRDLAGKWLADSAVRS